MVAIEKTLTVKITPKLAARIAERFEHEPLSGLYERLEPWVKKVYRTGLKTAMKGEIASFDKPTIPGRTATVRILRSQVRRLVIVAPVYGRMMGDMIEEKLWELLA